MSVLCLWQLNKKKTSVGVGTTSISHTLTNNFFAYFTQYRTPCRGENVETLNFFIEDRNVETEKLSLKRVLKLGSHWLTLNTVFPNYFCAVLSIRGYISGLASKRNPHVFNTLWWPWILIRSQAGSESASWRSGKNSEALAHLKPDLMLRTALNFPLSLPLQPGAEEGLEPDWDEAVYDPRLDSND